MLVYTWDFFLPPYSGSGDYQCCGGILRASIDNLTRIESDKKDARQPIRELTPRRFQSANTLSSCLRFLFVLKTNQSPTKHALL